MKNALTINFAEEKIVMTTLFAKKCSNTSSSEYAQLQSVRRDYPNYEVVTRQIKKNSSKKVYKGLTYDYMRDYIILHTTPEEETAAVAEFNEMLLISKCQQQSLRYPTIKKWFLNRYPEIADFGTLAAEVADQGQENTEEAKNQSVIPMQSETQQKTKSA